MPSPTSSLLSASTGRENKKSCEAFLIPLWGTDKLESEAGSIFSPSCKSAERIPAHCLMSLLNHFCWRPLFIKGGANGFDHNTIFTSWGLQPVSLQPVVQGVVQGVEAVPQQVSPPLFLLFSVPLWLFTH